MFGWMEKMAATTAEPEEPAVAMDGILITGRAGFVSGMHVATAHGWRAVDDLRVGDRVLTFDNGFQPIMDLQREAVTFADGAVPNETSPILVPKGALGNGADIWMMPDQGLLVESDTVLDMTDDPFAIVPAQALKGFRGIRAALPEHSMRISTLAFGQDEVIYVEGGLLAHCPRPRSILTEAVPKRGLYEVLNPRAARYLVSCLVEDNDVGALVCDDEEIANITAREHRSEAPVPA